MMKMMTRTQLAALLFAVAVAAAAAAADCVEQSDDVFVIPALSSVHALSPFVAPSVLAPQTVHLAAFELAAAVAVVAATPFADESHVAGGLPSLDSLAGIASARSVVMLLQRKMMNWIQMLMIL
jgi:ABC-type amino acid transport substrate-binding protein